MTTFARVTLLSARGHVDDEIAFVLRRSAALVRAYRELHAQHAREDGSDAPAPIAFSPDGRQFAIAHNQSTMRLYAIGTWTLYAELALPEACYIGAATFSPDGRWLGGEEHQLRRTFSRFSAKPVDLYRSGFCWLCRVYFSVPHFSVSSPEFTEKLTERYRTER